jgi:heterotetrameric sarcosine oxidase delta subunit
MLRIDCPFCGMRDETEFVYGGDAARRRPDLQENSLEVWNDHVFLRDNPKGPHQEYWFHQHGCRSWLQVERNVATHEITNVRFACTNEGER